MYVCMCCWASKIKLTSVWLKWFVLPFLKLKTASLWRFYWFALNFYLRFLYRQKGRFCSGLGRVSQQICIAQNPNYEAGAFRTKLYFFVSGRKLEALAGFLYARLNSHVLSHEKKQGHPTTVFCKIRHQERMIIILSWPHISVRRSKFCLEFFLAWGRLKISRWTFHSRTIFELI